jgi:hypothetical protein
MRTSFRTRIKYKNLTSFTILSDAKQDLTLRISNFPAGFLLVKISRTIFINVFRTIQNNPTGVFAIPEI